MKELKEKMMELGYTRIEDKTDNSFTAAAEDVVVYVEKVEVKELDPVLVNAFMFKAMEINPLKEVFGRYIHRKAQNKKAPQKETLFFIKY